MKDNPNFIEENKADICASLQKTIIDILMDKVIKAADDTGISQVALAGGVSANSGLRNRLTELAKQKKWETFIPKFSYTTDNAAMIAINGYHKYLKKEFVKQDTAPFARTEF